MIINALPPMAANSGLSIETGEYAAAYYTDYNYSLSNPPSITFEGKPRLVFIYAAVSGQKSTFAPNWGVLSVDSGYGFLCVAEQGLTENTEVQVWAKDNVLYYYYAQETTANSNNFYNNKYLFLGSSTISDTYRWIALTEK